MPIKHVKKRAKLLRLVSVPNAVKTRVLAQLRRAASADVAQGSDVQLFGPSFFCVELPEEQHEIRPKLFRLARGCGNSGARFSEDRGSLFLRARCGKTVLQPMIGKPRSVF